MHFGDLAGQDHLSCRTPHLKEIRRQGGQAAEYELVERKVIVADKAYIRPYGKTAGGHVAYQFRQSAVKPASGHEKQIFLTNGRRHFLQYVHGDRMFVTELPDSLSDKVSIQTDRQRDITKTSIFAYAPKQSSTPRATFALFSPKV